MLYNITYDNTDSAHELPSKQDKHADHEFTAQVVSTFAEAILGAVAVDADWLSVSYATYEVAG